jgi:GDP-4-dehydro-6-deoxy-D-mannose reductase
MMDRKALITGADGFAGRLLRAHLEKGGWDVVGCDVRPSSDDPRLCACDVSDRDQVFAAVRWAAPITHVFHLAAITFIPETVRNPWRTFEVNLQGTVLLTDALREFAPDARLLNIGSAAMYGAPRFLPMTEDHPLDPANTYAISKTAADQYCGFLSKAGVLDIIRVRPFNHTGPGQPDLFVLASFAHQVAQAEAGRIEPVMHVGNLDTGRDFLHVNDVIRAYELIATKGQKGEVYNISSGKAVSIRKALDTLLDMATVPIRVEQDPERMRAVDVPEAYGSYERLAAHTGWKPEILFEQLLRELLDYWREVEAGRR